MIMAPLLGRFKEHLKIMALRWPFSLSKSKTNHKVVLSSESVCETVDGFHEYKIKGYSLVKGIGVGECMRSRIFTVGGHDWFIKFYPDGLSEDDEEYVSVFLDLANTTNKGDVRALFDLKLIDHSGEEDYGDTSISPNTFNNTIKRSWGYPKFIKRSDLERSNYLKDDCLSIYCTLGIVQTRDETVENCVTTLQTRIKDGKHNVFPVPPSDMVQNFKGLLESGIGCDITFHVGNETFRAHKLILAARSPVFRAQFFGSVGDPDMETVTIEEFEPFAFKAMLLFLYSDEVPETRELSNSDCPSTSTTIMQHLLAAADRFGLTRLKILCEEKLYEEMNANTVATTLALAERHQCPQLKTVCLNFAAKPENLAEVMKSDGYAYLEKSLLSDLLKTSALVDKK